MRKEKVLVAGATGYLGQYLVRELKKRDYFVRVLIRDKKQKKIFLNVDEYFIGDITKPETLKNITNDIDFVFSTIGITRQKDGLTYMDVDYQGNLNLLKEAEKTPVKKFQYISAINGNKFKNLKIFEAKEKFVEELKNSPLKYNIMRPNGFFSDMKDFLEMAKSGRVYLFGHGNFKFNPIHGDDLAKVCIDKMFSEEEESVVGGPEVFSHNELAFLALKSWNKEIKITQFPDWVRILVVKLLKIFTSSKTYGPVEFFLTMMGDDAIAPKYGKRKLEDFFNEEIKKEDINNKYSLLKI